MIANMFNPHDMSEMDTHLFEMKNLLIKDKKTQAVEFSKVALGWSKPESTFFYIALHRKGLYIRYF